jgi:hypothetical protein
VLENTKVHPIRRIARRTENYPILETFLFLITTLRFGGVGAPEGRKKVPDHIFLEFKKNCVSGGRLWNQPDFLQNCVSGGRLRMQLEPKFSAKFVKMGLLICDILGDVEG